MEQREKYRMNSFWAIILNNAEWFCFMILFEQDPNWYRARNEKGQEGMIPANYVQKREGVKRQTMP